MPSPRMTALTAILEREIRVPGDLPALAARYRSARPFPHIVIDNMFSADVLDGLVAEIPSKKREHWVENDYAGLEKKLRQRSVIDLQETGLELIAFLHSAAFLYFLTELTGIRELLPDPYLQGGGFSVMAPGGFFNVHVDRNVAYETGLTRRVALIIYLNKSWQAEYGGQFELWNEDGTRREVTVEPIFNRTIVFEVAERNYHGVPTPVACPSDRSRDSFQVYYHTVGIDGRTDIVPHTSIFAPRDQLAPTALREQIREWVPPVLYRALKKVVKRSG